MNIPRNYKPTRGSRKYAIYSLEKLQKALQGGALNQRQVPVLYNIPRSTLKNNLKIAHSSKYGGQSIFTATEEAIFKLCFEIF